MAKTQPNPLSDDQIATTTKAVDALPIETAPRDGTLLRLLVDYTDEGENPLEDKYQAWTIGLNQFSDTGEDVWDFAGWSWEQDCFTAGVGKVIGWLPFHSSSHDLVSVQEAAKVLLNDRTALAMMVDVAEEINSAGVSFNCVVGNALRAIAEGGEA